MLVKNIFKSKRFLKYVVLFFIACLPISCFAFEDYMISTNGKLTNITIQDNTVVDIYPLITVLNKKNTLIIHPLKEGETIFSVVKNEKKKYEFYVRTSQDKTFVTPMEGFEVLAIDIPPIETEEDNEEEEKLDLPPENIEELG